MPDSLSVLRELLDKATPGPWSMRFQPQDRSGPAGWHLGSERVETLADLGDDPSAERDAALIVALRNEADGLLARVAAAEEVAIELGGFGGSHRRTSADADGHP